MRILIIVHSVSWKGGGNFFHAYHIAKSLKDKGHNVSIMATSPTRRWRIDRKLVCEVTLIEFPDILTGSARNGWDPYNTFRRILYLTKLKEGFDIIHCLDCRPVVIFPGLYLKYFKKIKLIIEWLDLFGKGGTASERSLPLRLFMYPIETFFEEKFRKYADGTIALGSPLGNRAVKLGLNHNLLIITHGCDNLKINSFSISEAKTRLNLDENKIYIGYAGRLREDVLKIFVKSIEKLNLEYGYDTIGVFIGNMSFDISTYINSSNAKFFLITGWINYQEMNNYLCACSILTLPFNNSISRNNIWPSKINDYLSVGRPIVSTKLEILEDVFKNNIGIMCTPDSASMAEACHQILNNKHQAIEMGLNAKKIAIEKYDWSVVSMLVEEFYQKVLGDIIIHPDKK
jgi:glycosyltransferase involved in cell wall biosynthesis